MMMMMGDDDDDDEFKKWTVCHVTAIGNPVPWNH